MPKSPNLQLPFLAPAQAQKHVTVNESLEALDAVTQCAVIAMFRDAPPETPGEGDRYILGSAPTGLWAGEAGRLAYYANGGWAFVTPRPGWRVYNLADDTLYLLGAALGWSSLSGAGGGAEIQNATRIGLGAAADGANPFTAKLNSGLWTARTAAEGGTGDLFLTLNKSEASRDAGYVFQSGFVTRAIAGLFGSNRFRIAVSADGASFRDALSVDEASGMVSQPHLPRFKAYTNFDNLGQVDVWGKIAINVAETNDQDVFDPASNRFTAPAAGSYLFGAAAVYKMNASTSARLRVRLALNGTTLIRGSFAENTAAHVSEATALSIQTMALLAAGDTVELQGNFRTATGYFAANHTTFWGCRIG